MPCYAIKICSMLCAFLASNPLPPLESDESRTIAIQLLNFSTTRAKCFPISIPSISILRKVHASPWITPTMTSSFLSPHWRTAYNIIGVESLPSCLEMLSNSFKSSSETWSFSKPSAIIIHHIPCHPMWHISTNFPQSRCYPKIFSPVLEIPEFLPWPMVQKVDPLEKFLMNPQPLISFASPTLCTVIPRWNLSLKTPSPKSIVP